MLAIFGDRYPLHISKISRKKNSVSFFLDTFCILFLKYLTSIHTSRIKSSRSAPAAAGAESQKGGGDSAG